MGEGEYIIWHGDRCVQILRKGQASMWVIDRRNWRAAIWGPGDFRPIFYGESPPQGWEIPFPDKDED